MGIAIENVVNFFVIIWFILKSVVYIFVFWKGVVVDIWCVFIVIMLKKVEEMIRDYLVYIKFVEVY